MMYSNSRDPGGTSQEEVLTCFGLSTELRAWEPVGRARAGSQDQAEEK